MTVKHRRHRQHGNPFNIRGPIPRPDWEQIYGRQAPFALDVGFGPGAFLLELARRHPEWNVLGLEIRDFFVQDVLSAARQLGLHNLHAMVANANTHLQELLDDESVIFVSLNFPDPWFKKRHHKRRVINEAWLDLLSRKMLPGASLHYASDFEEGALQAKELLDGHAAYHAPRPGFLPESTTGIVSERELTHQRRGEPIYRLHYIKL